MSQEAGTCGIPIFFFLWDIVFMSGVTGYASHSGSCSGFQWVISPLSWHAYSVLASQGWPVPAILHLIGIELRTSQSTIQRLQPLNHVVDEFSVQMMVYMPQNILKHQRNWNFWKLKKLTFPGLEHPSQGSLTRIPDALTARPFGRWIWTWYLKI